MPWLSHLAARSVRFAGAVTPSPGTRPALASLLTGAMPSDHGDLDPRRAAGILPSVPAWAEVLEQALGYQTAAFVDGAADASPGGPLQGFRTAVGAVDLARLEESVGPWARARDPSRPFFLLLVTTEASAPWVPAAGSPPEPPEGAAPSEIARAWFLGARPPDDGPAGRRAWLEREALRYASEGHAEAPRPDLLRELRGAYEARLRRLDARLEAAVARLTNLGLLDGALLAVVSLHGEAFGEHGQIGSGRQLHGEVLRVPLVLRGPAPFDGGVAVAGAASLVDLVPTFFEWVGAPSPAPPEARSLLPLLAGRARGRPVAAEAVVTAETAGREADEALLAVRTEAWSYVLAHDRRAGTVRQALFDLRADPTESHDRLRPDGEGPALPDDLCAAIHEARQRLLLGAVALDRRREGTPYAAGVPTLEGLPAGPCDR